eukprot:TRINITY_DN49084_c0_g1_i1.p2 TRINITY_DN49084_c0_g1~~TRINITY_DN49084_c0_g1_i1.p2  ORF type:complete len:110 (-),score=8.46 TRINITY_DN49084_c0_g1_i1:36-365(-)
MPEQNQPQLEAPNCTSGETMCSTCSCILGILVWLMQLNLGASGTIIHIQGLPVLAHCTVAQNCVLGEEPTRTNLVVPLHCPAMSIVNRPELLERFWPSVQCQRRGLRNS